MANPNLLWIRDAVSIATDVGSPEFYIVDLLWKAKTGRTAQDSDVALADREPRTVFEGLLAPQDISGALVKRIIIEYVAGFAPIPQFVVDPSVANYDRYLRAGVYEGIEVATSPYTGVGTHTGVGEADAPPGGEQASVSRDWLWWARKYINGIDAQDSLGMGMNPVPPDPLGNWSSHSRKIDTRCSRRLQEWDDTLLFELEPSADETLNHLAMSWSVLLSLPA